MTQGNMTQGNMKQGNMTQGNMTQVNMKQGNITRNKKYYYFILYLNKHTLQKIETDF